MNGASKEIIYLDANILLDWVGRAVARPGVAGIIQVILDDKIVAITSAISRLEVLECKNDPHMWKAWQAFRAGKNVQVLAVTSKVIDIAHEIRNHYAALRLADEKQKRTCTPPDAIHVATAIYANCNRMLTFDRGDKDKNKIVSPLDMDGRVAGKWPLNITEPDPNLQALDV